MKRCARCKKLKPKSEFHANKRRKDGLSLYCRVCASRMSREWYQNNRGRAQENQRKYHKAHPGRAKENSHKYYKAHPKKMNESSRKYRKENPEKVRKIDRKCRLKKYGLTMEDYNRVFEAQGGVCAICGEPERVRSSLSVDHDHYTGELRELVCSHCNIAMGHIDDSPTKARKMADYLEKHLLKKKVKRT